MMMDVLDSIIPMMKDSGILPVVFFTESNGSINIILEEFEADLREELLKYE
jgi:hypothetical protein